MFHLLIVDDQELIRRLLSEALVQEGYSVSTAADAKEAKDHLTSIGADLVITDIDMPGESGVDLLDWTKEQMPMVPVILMSGGLETRVHVTAEKHGAAAGLQKPFSMRLMSDLIVCVLARSSVPHPVTG